MFGGTSTTDALEVHAGASAHPQANALSATIDIQHVSKRRIEGDEEDDHGDEDHDHDHDDHGDESTTKPWGEVIGFSLLVNLVTLSGVIFLAFPAVKSVLMHNVVHSMSPAADKEIHAHASAKNPPEDFSEDEESPVKKGAPRTQEHSTALDIFIPSFAAGALIATVVFLVIPEALQLLNVSFAAEEDAHDAGHEDHDRRFLEGEGEGEGHDEHAGEIVPDAIWRFGAGLMGGYLLPIIIGFLFPKSHNITHENVEDETAGKTGAARKEQVDYTLALSILLGDAFHNFCDGIFMGVAFMLCDRKTAYTIFAVTLYHEIAQEIADFFLLTKHAGLTVWKALLGNFLAGLSIVIGGIVVLLVDVSNLTIGVILSMSAGVYSHIAATECMARVNAVVRTNSERLITIVAFIVGAVPIGLTLLAHSHCDGDH